MSQTKALVSELKREAANTRKMLERIATEQFGWKPHEKNRGNNYVNGPHC